MIQLLNIQHILSQNIAHVKHIFLLKKYQLPSPTHSLSVTLRHTTPPRSSLSTFSPRSSSRHGVSRSTSGIHKPVRQHTITLKHPIKHPRYSTYKQTLNLSSLRAERRGQGIFKLIKNKKERAINQPSLKNTYLNSVTTDGQAQGLNCLLGATFPFLARSSIPTPQAFRYPCIQASPFC